MAVRLFIGNLPYGASEADLRAHFAAVAEPSHVAMPVDRETGRPRGFAFVEFAERAVAEEVIRKFDSQPFQGRPLAVSEARAREDRPPPTTWWWRLRTAARRRWWWIRRSTPRWWRRIRRTTSLGGGGFGGPRPGGFGGPPAGPGGRDRSANFGPPAPPKRLRGKKTSQQEHKPRGPIKENEPEGASTLSTISRTTHGRDRRRRHQGGRGRLDGRNRRCEKSDEGVDDQDEE